MEINPAKYELCPPVGWKRCWNIPHPVGWNKGEVLHEVSLHCTEILSFSVALDWWFSIDHDVDHQS